MAIRKDGTVVPSFFNVDKGKRHKIIPGNNNFSLKIGTITHIHYPDETKSNLRKTKIEYDVVIKERDGNRAISESDYRRCITSDLFGGIADYFEYTHRPSTRKLNDTDPIFRNGSTVLILCQDGDTNAGRIIGGIRNELKPETSNKERGHFLEFEFNGVNFEINKDGELTLTWKARTDIEGASQDEEAGGSYFKVDKTGSIEFNDNKALQIRMDKPTSDITIKTTERDIIIDAKRDLNVTTGKDLNITVDGQAVVQVKKNATVTVDGQADITVKKDMNVKVSGKTTLVSKGKVDVKTESDAFVTAKGDIDAKTDGDALVTAKGKAKVKAPLVELTDSSTGGSDGVITGDSIDPFTGVKHIDFSGIVRAKK